MPPLTPDLVALRATLDQLDDQIHDLLMARAAVVEQVAGTKRGVALRPGREAAILRRLLARHTGTLAPHAILRIWREVFAASTALQGRFSIVIAGPNPENLARLARAHFGTTATLHHRPAPAEALAALRAGTASAAILPCPTRNEAAAAAWWPGLLDEPRLHVVARLPFWPIPGAVPALVVSSNPPDASGQDCTVILRPVHETSDDPIIASIVGETAVLIEMDGFLTEGDPLIAAVDPPALVLGAYAIPVF